MFVNLKINWPLHLSPLLTWMFFCLSFHFSHHSQGKPQLFAISPLDPPISLLKTSEDYPDVCLASNLPPSAGMLSMNLCGGRVSHNITGTISSHNKSYHFAFSSRSMDFCEADGTYSHYRNGERTRLPKGNHFIWCLCDRRLLCFHTVDVCDKVHPGESPDQTPEHIWMHISVSSGLCFSLERCHPLFQVTHRWTPTCWSWMQCVWPSPRCWPSPLSWPSKSWFTDASLWCRGWAVDLWSQRSLIAPGGYRLASISV